MTEPPHSTWYPPQEVTAEVVHWLQLASFIALGLAILATIAFGALLILDKERGQSVSATSPHVRFLTIALGVMIISGASSFATWLIA